MNTLTITKIEPQHSIADNVDFLDVSFAIADDGTTVYEGRQGFPLDTPEDEIKAQLGKVLSTFLSDQELAAESAKVEAAQQQAQETIAALDGFQINAESNQ